MHMTVLLGAVRGPREVLSLRVNRCGSQYKNMDNCGHDGASVQKHWLRQGLVEGRPCSKAQAIPQFA